ncbi:MAG: hypothetical protein NZ570_02680 [Candidatus Caldarchaeum sp.]|nr:hypothetical protein [Candidatus Caldarchaeum sp.]MCS7137739.1 hypothetical protein [Candidatus Caldarchaeum sp.]MDW7977453.1 hypothetical protein [Candidatus Caldarchaeum sp.]MDW8359043.1 hypothetical protein [Candidatus Caldarchaeum sp.]
MERLKSVKAASIILFVHGAVEVVGVVLAPFAPAEFLPQSLQGTWAFTSLLSLVYGVSRLVAAAAVWGLKKWGTAFGAALCVSTLAAAPSIYPLRRHGFASRRNGPSTPSACMVRRGETLLMNAGGGI